MERRIRRNNRSKKATEREREREPEDILNIQRSGKDNKINRQTSKAMATKRKIYMSRNKKDELTNRCKKLYYKQN